MLTCGTFVLCLWDFLLYNFHADMWDFCPVFMRLYIVQLPCWHVGLLFCVYETLYYTTSMLTCGTFVLCLWEFILYNFHADMWDIFPVFVRIYHKKYFLMFFHILSFYSYRKKHKYGQRLKQSDCIMWLMHGKYSKNSSKGIILTASCTSILNISINILIFKTLVKSCSRSWLHKIVPQYPPSGSHVCHLPYYKPDSTLCAIWLIN